MKLTLFALALTLFVAASAICGSLILSAEGGKVSRSEHRTMGKPQHNPSFSADEIYFRDHSLPEKGEDFQLPDEVRAALERDGRKPTWNAYFMAWDALRHGLSQRALVAQLLKSDDERYREAVEWRRRADEEMASRARR